MIDYINVKLTVNYDAEIEDTVEFMSRLCAEAYVVRTVPYNPSWCTVEVRLGECDEDGTFDIGLAEITIPRKDSPLLCGLVDHVLGYRDWNWRELDERAKQYDACEQAAYGRRIA